MLHKIVLLSAALAFFSFASCSSEKAQHATTAKAEQGHALHVSPATATGEAEQTHREMHTPMAGVADSTVPTHPAGAVESDLVCMVNNAYMGRKQLPVAFEGQTYYGCCEMCVAKIQNNREVRYAFDPVTGEEVDKAKAFIVLKPGAVNGDVLYFASEETYKRFN